MRRKISSLRRSAYLLTAVLAAVLMYGCGAGKLPLPGLTTTNDTPAVQEPLKEPEFYVLLFDEAYKAKYKSFQQSFSSDGSRLLLGSGTKHGSADITDYSLWKFSKEHDTYIKMTLDDIETDSGRGFLDYDNSTECLSRTTLQCPLHVAMSENGKALLAVVNKTAHQPGKRLPDKLIYTVHPDEKKFRKIPIEPEVWSISSAVISPDGTHIAAPVDYKYKNKYRKRLDYPPYSKLVTEVKDRTKIEVYSLISGKKITSKESWDEMVVPVAFDPFNNNIMFKNPGHRYLNEYILQYSVQDMKYIREWREMRNFHGFSPDGKTAVLSNQNQKRALLFDIYKGQTVKSWENADPVFIHVSGFSPETAIFADGKSIIYDYEKNTVSEYAEYPEFNTHTAFAPNGRLMRIWTNSADEHFRNSGKLLLLKSVSMTRTTAPTAVFVEAADAWYIFRGHETFRNNTADADTLKASEALHEGLELLKAGFTSPALDKIKQAMSFDPLNYYFRGTKFYTDLAEKKVPLRDIGDILLYNIEKAEEKAERRNLAGYGRRMNSNNELEVIFVSENTPAEKAGFRKGDIITAFNGKPVRRTGDDSFDDTPPGTEAEVRVIRNGQELILKTSTVKGINSIVNIIPRLANYGMFAVKAGHPALAKQAADRIRAYKSVYPASTLWESAYKYASMLDALALSAAGAPDKAYDYLMGEGGLVHDGFTGAKDALLFSPDYWSPLYGDRKKLAFLLEMEVKDLPQAKPFKPEPQAYPDISGKIIQPLSSPPLLEKSPQMPLPEEPKQDKGVPKGRVLD